MTSIASLYGYPQLYQTTASPMGNAATQLDAEYARDFGLGTSPVYNLPINANMGYGNYGYGMGMGMGAYGMGMGMGMYMNPYMMPTQQYLEYLNMNPKERLKYDSELRDMGREIQYNEGKSAKNYAAATDGQTGPMREACRALQTVIIEGESDQIVKQFERIVTSLRNSSLYTRFKEEYAGDTVGLEMALRNSAKEQFQAATGQDLTAMIQEHCDSALANGFWNTISFGNAQKYSAEDIIAKINGTQTPKTASGNAVVGKAGGVLASMGAGAAAGVAIGTIGGPIGWLGGMLIGGAAGLIGAFVS